MQHPAYSIGIDIGTGSTKAVAVDAAGVTVASAQEYYPTLHPQAAYAEQEPEAVWTAFVACLSSITQTIGAPAAVVCISSQMHSLLLMDERHQPLTNSILWSDSRSADVAKRLRESEEGKAIYASTGTPLHAMSPLCKLLWLREEEPALFASAHKFVSIKEWIWFRLFGEWQVDWSIASATGLFNHQRFQWDEAALQLTGLSADRLSALVATTYTRHGLSTDVAALVNLPSSTPFCIGASDGCFANAGSDALSPGAAAVTIGTSAAVRIASATPIINTEAMPFSYVLDERLFICGAPANNGGNVVQWLQQQFFDSEKKYDELMQEAAVVAPGSEGLLCLPHLHGERAPVWDEASAGAFIGIRPHHTKAHFLRAALEGICYSLRSSLELLERQSSPVSVLHASGGFVHSKVWVQLLANVVGKPVAVIQTGDASAHGAALWGWKTTHRPVHPRLADDGLKYLPAAGAQTVYNRYFAIYCQLYPALKDSFHQLHQLHR